MNYPGTLGRFGYEAEPKDGGGWTIWHWADLLGTAETLGEADEIAEEHAYDMSMVRA